MCRLRTRAVGGTARIPAMWLCPALRSDCSSPGLHGRLYISISMSISIYIPNHFAIHPQLTAERVTQ